MTFAVVQTENNRSTIVGTIWSSGESEAQLMAANLTDGTLGQPLVVRKTEDRELPLKINE